MNWIDFRELPPSAGGFSDLFLDYVYDYQRVRQFFRTDFRENAAYETLLKTLQEHPHANRVQMADILLPFHQNLGSPERTFENIAALRKPTTFAVVTGQQVGLLGGPMYTVLKTLTTIALSRKLKEKYPRWDFVPVFWLEGEDHDFAEMNHARVIDGQGATVNIEYLPGGVLPERNPGPVGEMVFDSSLEHTIGTLRSALPQTEFTGDLIARIRECYREGTTFNTAFARWLQYLFPEAGLVFLSANNPGIKRLLSPLFVNEVTQYPVTSQIVIGQSAELEEHYHAQVKPKSINLFLFHNGGRYPIEPRENDFTLKGTRHFITPDELQHIAAETPELLSPNVILRPLAQDTLLPTIAYVAGPSEIAYHAQLAPLYDHFGVIQPIVYPRASATIVEERVQKVLEKFGLTITDLFGDASRLTSRVVEQISEIKLDEMFDRSSAGIADALSELKFGLNEVDPTLTGALENAIGKITTTVTVLKEKSVAAQKRQHETAVRQIEKAVGAILPGGILQERQLSMLPFLNKYGPDVIRWLEHNVEIAGFKHQILMR
jgi:bacillithiol biosynthesis cysteine-adding enzyme BshC